jgi:large conductance mechanosensitive channel
MPPLGLVTGGVDFKELAWNLRAAQGARPAVVMKYGAFLQTVFDFLLVAISIFAMVQVITKLKRSEHAPAPVVVPPSKQELLLEQIRDAVRAQRT